MKKKNKNIRDDLVDPNRDPARDAYERNSGTSGEVDVPMKK